MLLQSQLYVLTLIRCPFHPRVTAVAREKSRSFCQKCRWQVTTKHAYNLDPTKSVWTDYAAIQVQCGNLCGNELTRNSSRNIRPQSSQPAKPLWTDPGTKSRISARELISTSKKKKRKKKVQARNEWSNIPPNPRKRGKKSQYHTHKLHRPPILVMRVTFYSSGRRPKHTST